MPRTKKYESGAAKQRAYRERQARMKRNALALRNDDDLSSILPDPNSSKPSRPPVRYYGGKWRLGSWIIEQFPPHTAYLEPFCGGAGVLFQKEPSKYEIINDLNGEVVNFFDMLRSRTDELVRAIDLTPFSREEHRRAHLVRNHPDPVERARRFYVRSKQSFGAGEGRYNTGWRYQANDKRGTTCIDEWNTLDHLYIAARRLKTVQIECDNALRAIERFDTPETLHYVDPPYLMSTRYSNEPRYAEEMTDEQHCELAELLNHAKGMVLISGYASELYNDLYAGWRRIAKAARTNGGYDSTEFLWISPKADALNRLPLFAAMD